MKSTSFTKNTKLESIVWYSYPEILPDRDGPYLVSIMGNDLWVGIVPWAGYWVQHGKNVRSWAVVPKPFMKV